MTPRRVLSNMFDAYYLLRIKTVYSERQRRTTPQRAECEHGWKELARAIGRSSRRVWHRYVRRGIPESSESVEFGPDTSKMRTESTQDRSREASRGIWNRPEIDLGTLLEYPGVPETSRKHLGMSPDHLKRCPGVVQERPGALLSVKKSS